MEEKTNNISEINDKDEAPIRHWHGHHHGLKLAMVIIGILIVAGGAMAVAKFAGRHENFGNKVNVERTMVSGRGMMGRGSGFGKQGFGRGVSGDVTKINSNTLTINNGVKDIAVNIQSTTSFTKNGQVAKQSDLIVGNNVVVIGASDSNGVVQATKVLIR